MAWRLSKENTLTTMELKQASRFLKWRKERRVRFTASYCNAAIASISTNAPLGNAATCTVARAGKGFSKNVNTEVGDFAFVRAKADEFHTQQGIVSITNENGIFNANIRFMDVVPDDFGSGLSDKGALKESNNSFKFNKNDFTTIDQILNKHGYRFQLIKKTTVDDLYNISTARYNETNSYNMLYNNCWQQTRRFAQLA